VRHVDWEIIKCLVIAGPGFAKDKFLEYLNAEAVKRELKCAAHSCFQTVLWFVIGTRKRPLPLSVACSDVSCIRVLPLIGAKANTWLTNGVSTRAQGVPDAQAQHHRGTGVVGLQALAEGAVLCAGPRVSDQGAGICRVPSHKAEESGLSAAGTGDIASNPLCDLEATVNWLKRSSEFGGDLGTEPLGVFTSTRMCMNPKPYAAHAQDTKAAKEVQVLQDFFDMLSSDPARAFYGPGAPRSKYLFPCKFLLP